MQVFEKAIIKKFWPADEKGPNDEIIRQLVIQVEVDLDNSRQVGELFNNMVRGLVRITFMDNLTGEEYILPAITIKPFNVKQRKVKIGKGEDAEVVKSEYAALQLVSAIKDNNGGSVLADLYRFFNIELQMSVEELKYFESHSNETTPIDQDNSTDQDDEDESVDEDNTGFTEEA